MNIYEKIQRVRVDFMSKKITMSGKNEFAKYDYFELDDFIEPLNELMAKYGMTAYPSFTSELATLTAVNCEQPEEKVVITSPMGSASLKGCHEVQNIGAVETYQRRYLYQALFDIAEHDGLDGTQGQDEKQKKKGKAENPLKGNDHLKLEEKKPKPSDVLDLPGADNVDNKTLFVHALKIAGLTNEQGGQILKDMFGDKVKVNDLDEADFANLIAALE